MSRSTPSRDAVVKITNPMHLVKITNPMHNSDLSREENMAGSFDHEDQGYDVPDTAQSFQFAATGKKSAPAVSDFDMLMSEDIADCRHTFDTADEDNSGAIDLEEFTRIIQLWGVTGGGSARSMAEDLHAEGKKLPPVENEDELMELIQWDPPKIAAGDDEVTFPQFLRLLLSGKIDEATEDWKLGTQQYRLIKFAFEMADLDGNGDLEKGELEEVINTLHGGAPINHENFERLWSTIAAGKPSLNSADFIDGMVVLRGDEALSKMFRVTEINPLTGVVLDIPVPPWETRMVVEGLGALELFGMWVQKQMKVPPLKREGKNELLRKAKAGELHELTYIQKTGLQKLHRRSLWHATHIGFWTSLVCAATEVFAMVRYDTDGVADLREYCMENATAFGCATLGCAAEGTCTQEDEDALHLRIMWFWILAGSSLGVTVAIELTLLYVYQVYNCVSVAGAMGFQLLPMNRDRARINVGLIRASLEIEAADDVVMGVNPQREVSSNMMIINMMRVMLYKAKVAMTGFFSKVVLRRLLTRGGAKMALPWITVPVTTVWDVAVGHFVMSEAKLRATGMATTVEIFNSIVLSDDREALSDQAKLQMARAIGVNIVKARNMHPTLEILLKHALSYLGLSDMFKGENNVSGSLDDAAVFLDGFEDLSQNERKAVLHVAMLSCVADGCAGKRQTKLVQDAVDVCGWGPRCHVDYLRVLAQKMRMHDDIGIDDFELMTGGAIAPEFPPEFRGREIRHKMVALCTC